MTFKLLIITINYKNLQEFFRTVENSINQSCQELEYLIISSLLLTISC